MTIRNFDGVCTIPGLSELNTYKVRVSAFNKSAASEPKYIDEPYTPHIIYVEPEDEVDCSLKQSLKVKAGMILRICAKLSGNPFPTTSWKKDNMPLPDRAFTETSGDTCKIEIEKSAKAMEALLNAGTDHIITVFVVIVV